jgi:hypothetical protein
VGTASSLVHGGQLVRQVIDGVESSLVALRETMALEVRRINVGSLSHQAVGNMAVPARMFAVSVGDKCYKPRRGRRPMVDDNAAATTTQFDWFCGRHTADLLHHA